MVHVPAGENILAAALAAGLPLPHSCREGRCASCKARLLSGEFFYPGEILPPGITPEESARGELLLCQARPRGDLIVETRRAVVAGARVAGVTVLAVRQLPFDALQVRLRVDSGQLKVRPGQFVDAVNLSAFAARLAVIASREGELELEVASDAGALREWLAAPGAVGETLALTGPFDTPR